MLDTSVCVRFIFWLNSERQDSALRFIKAWVTLPLTHIFHKIENNLAILRGIFLILGRNVYHYHLSQTKLWQRNLILSTAKNS